MQKDIGTSQVIEEMKAFRQHMKTELGEEAYQEQLEPFKTELEKVDRPADVTFIELADIVADKIDLNPELSDDAKELGKALYCLAAVDLMGEDKFIDWLTFN